MNQLHVIVIFISALAMSTTSAHVLEFLPKKQLSVPDYTLINSHLYRDFAIVGGAYCMASIILSLLVVFKTKRIEKGFVYFVLASFSHLGWLLSWLILVQPVNMEAAEAMKQSVGATHRVWEALRYQWEYGHMAGFIFHIAAFTFFLTGCQQLCDKQLAGRVVKM